LSSGKKAKLAAVSGLLLLGGMAVDRAQSNQPESQPKPQHQDSPASQDVHKKSKPVSGEIDQLPAAETTAVSDQPASWWPVAVKQNWQNIISSSTNYGLDPHLAATIVAEESGGQNIDNKSGATGLMQIMPSTAREIARLRKRSYYNMHNPLENLDYGCWLIDYINQKFIAARGVDINSDFGIAMLAVGYGDGVGALQEWIDSGFDPSSLSEQAKAVSSLWKGMYDSRGKINSDIFTSIRGG